ncbi:TetR/AcrR family transcriptional regulator [Actinopolymorpha pittospori]
MTKPAEPDHRRRQVASALLAVVAKEGVEGASLSRVAAAAGTSVGLIQRYFQTKDQLLHFAFGYLWERTVERVRSVEPSDSVRTTLVRMLATFLPVDEERVFESRMWLAYIARAAVDPALACGHAEGMREIRERCAEALRFAQSTGEAPARLDPDREALMLAAFLDGLLVDMVGDPNALPPTTGVRALESYVDRLFADAGAGAP